MATDEWLARWQEGRIGFHRSAPHDALMRHWPSLGTQPGGKVLVPLCGKSLDMRWLAAQGHPVLGLELSSLAIEQFMAEGEAPISRYTQGAFTCCRQGSIELWCGDFFHFHTAQVEELSAFYDRAALIALPEATRQRYAFHLAQLLLPGARGLLISLVDTHSSEGGPPYTVADDEVERLFAANFELTHLEKRPPDESGKQESVWSLVRRGPRQA
ncbi:thiopurine S-methyltransferase [Chromohalobacter sp. HP20-39]|uniref:thiopurine S-methyltransferase n=1 Tax=Chromohalobacter sp. HP20-39 TaxID=3079306 RepID=UPI00294AB1E9|nr:thiopurine S-methyltransferase [Chromohalobacter sp. HP20-39]MDV6318739.1 thiopurine S-methyltransferase [Chromohalobacter sp. HP20-39]